jgi:hypothetical protein
MDKNANLNNVEKKIKYIKPSTEKHEPIKIIQGSGEEYSRYYDGCGYLYYVSLYYY